MLARPIQRRFEDEVVFHCEEGDERRMVVGRYGAIGHSLDADDAMVVVGLMMIGMVCGVWLGGSVLVCCEMNQLMCIILVSPSCISVSLSPVRVRVFCAPRRF